MPQDANTPSLAPSTATPRQITPYVAIWSGLATFSFIYICVAIVWPDAFGEATPDPLSQPLAQSDERLPKQTPEEAALAAKLAKMEEELHRERAANKQSENERKSHLDRIAALEAKAAKAEQNLQENAPQPAATDTATNIEAAPTSTKQAADQIAERLGGTKILNAPEASAPKSAESNTTLVKQAASEPKTDAKANETVLTKTAKAPTQTDVAKPNPQQTTVAKAAPKKPAAKVAAAPQPKPAPAPKKPAAPQKVVQKKAPAIKTGSIDRSANPKPIAFGPAVVTRATKPIGIRLATGPSIDSLRLSWAALADRHGASVRSLQPRYVTGIDATGLTYDLVAGPFDTSADAIAVCARLHANGARCALGEFNGNALN